MKKWLRLGVAGASVSIASILALAAPASASAIPSPSVAVVQTAGKTGSVSLPELQHQIASNPLASNSSAAGWLGTCYSTPNPNNSRSGGGWCDGNGPDARYQGFVDCSNGGRYWGPEKWAGDRTRSYGTCPSGTSRLGYGVVGYYV
ncbi:hypothetical protein [Micromonospora craniellae]|uniref:hypothetical protein n=1 Tax=Micromonospora craniellae TaxID=2294034 RepID=UPI0011C0D464|nr:hypothetical protein [Micromonospora craniellae]QOC90535.1 hypothetical protein ID554_20515 [Micromonospora craniellae]